MNEHTRIKPTESYYMSPIFQKDAFSRPNGDDDSEFYSKDRFVSHLDALALKTVENIIGSLITEDCPISWTLWPVGTATYRTDSSRKRSWGWG